MLKEAALNAQFDERQVNINETCYWLRRSLN